jgi:mannose-6-phosphate isomerase class I
MIQKKQKIVMPSVDLGGTKIGFAFISIGQEREIALEYPPTEVVKNRGKTDAGKTLKLVADLVKKRTREATKRGWVVLKLLGIGAPGLYLKDGSVDPRTVPNIPGLAKIKPADALEDLLGKEWKVYINNDGVVQAVASADAFVRSSDYTRKWAKIVEETDGKVIYFGPGTGFGAGKVIVRKDKRVEPMPGSQAFFDILIRDGKTAEQLIGGYGIGKIAQLRERLNIEKGGNAVFLKFTEGYEGWSKDSDKLKEIQLSKISGKVVSKAYGSGQKEAKKMAKEIFVQVGRDLAELMIRLHKGKGKKSILQWDKNDWHSVKGTSVFLAAGLLTKPTGKEVILPSAREVLNNAGYSKKIYITEVDQLPTMGNVQGKIGIFGSSLIVPEKEILTRKWENFLIVGKNKINRYIADSTKRTSVEKHSPIFLAIDGYCGIDWHKSISQIKQRLEKEGLSLKMIDMSLYYKTPKEIDEIILPHMMDDKAFGRIFGGKLEDLLDENRVDGLKDMFEKFKKEKSKSPKAIICFGPGAACKPLRRLYDTIFYKDITREQITKRYKEGLVVPLGARSTDNSGKGQPAYLAGKRFHYIDFPVLDRHKKSLQKWIHFYIDDNLAGEPKLISQKILDEMISHMTQGPIQLKAFHDEGVWGGQWLKKIRKLPKEMVNCAWAYELMAYHMSVKIPVNETFIEMPFANVLDKEPDQIMGDRVNRMFKGIWPIRVNYDDCWGGGDMAIQIHPDSSYIKKNFREPLHQDESYYIMASTPDAYVHLGVKDGIDLWEFYEAVRKAETEGIPFDHRKYVNVFPAKEGDLFLIPGGTVHASGKGCVVLELSSTTDRYTFHFYDYLRPDLNGKLREIHSKHAFNMVNKYPHRTTPWVKKHLIQKPRLIRQGKDWAEYLLGKMNELVFEVHRFEFASTVEDDTKGAPHVLSVAKGDGVIIQSQVFPERKFLLNFSQTALVPACLGKYLIINQGHKPCNVLKTLVNTSWAKDK